MKTRYFSLIVYGFILFFTNLGYSSAPEFINISLDKESYLVGEKAFIRISMPVQPTNAKYEYNAQVNLDQNSLKSTVVSAKEAYALSNPLQATSANILTVKLYLQDKKFVKDSLTAIAGYKKRNAEIVDRLMIETDADIRASLLAQKQRNENFIAQAEQNIISHRSLISQKSKTLVISTKSPKTSFTSPTLELSSDRQDGRYLTGEAPIFFAKVSSGLQMPDGPAEFVVNGSTVGPNLNLMKKRLSALEFSFTGRALNIDDVGLHNFRAEVFYRSKAQSDSIRAGLDGIVKLQKEYIGKRNMANDIAEKEYYSLLIAELETAKANFQNHLANLLQLLGSPVQYVFEVLASSSQLAGIQVTSSLNGNLSEGSAFQLSVVLTGQPIQNVVVSVDPIEELKIGTAAVGDPVYLTFTPANWDVPQSLSVLSIDDLVDRGATYAAPIKFGVSSLDPRYMNMVVSDLPVVVTDNDQGQITISGDLNLEEDGTGSFQVKLNSLPTADVTLNVSTDGLTEVSSTTLNFDSTNWNTWQTIEVHSLDDNIDRGETYISTITLTGNSADSIYNALSDSIVASIIDNDEAGIQVQNVHGNNVAEGGNTADLRVRLRSEPSTVVTVNFDTGDQLQPIGSITFNASNWNQYRTVEVVAVDDSVVEGNHNGSVLVSASGGEYSAVDPETVGYNIEDNDVDLGAQMDAGLNQGCRIINEALFCWGGNWAGTLGTGDENHRSVPTPVLNMSTNVKKVSVGSATTCSIKGDQLFCWGANHAGQLGDGTTTKRSAPVAVLGMESGVTSVSVGDEHVCAVKTGNVYCWGSGHWGRLGQGNQTSYILPQLVTLPSAAKEVSAGPNHSCAILETGTLYCWGSNGSGQLGQSNTSGFFYSPIQVAGISNAKKVATGYANSCVIENSGLMCVGGEILLGRGTEIGYSYVPVAVTGLNTGVTSLSIQEYLICVAHEGAAVCWGRGQRGGTGSGSTANVYTPGVVAGLTGVTEVMNGSQFGCALSSSGLKCWGSDEVGSLGNDDVGGNADSFTPVDVVFPSKFRLKNH